MKFEISVRTRKADNEIKTIFSVKGEEVYGRKMNVSIAAAIADAMEFVAVTFFERYIRIDHCNELTTRVWVCYEQTTYGGKTRCVELACYDFIK